MKLELQKHQDYDGIWYVIVVNGTPRVWKRDLEEATAAYQYYLTNKIVEITTIETKEVWTWVIQTRRKGTALVINGKKTSVKNVTSLMMNAYAFRHVAQRQ